jgi:hypothetical protein
MQQKKTKKGSTSEEVEPFHFNFGGDLLSHTVSHAVSLAL